MGMTNQIKNQKNQSENWFRELRNQMVGAIQKVDGSNFEEKEWQRPGGGGKEGERDWSRDIRTYVKRHI